MVKEHPLKELVRLQKQGISKGICSVCSSHPYVIEAAIEKGIEEGNYVLIEATANQVNQFGGYTGMKPKDFADYVQSIAKNKGLSKEKLILGGDHLGPLVWKNEDIGSAMDKAEELIIEYVKAGFSKIHIDTSMHLASDLKDKKLDNKIIAGRAAMLYRAAEKAFKEVENKFSYHPVYVIGSEVPVPGGTQEEEGLQITKVQDLKDTLNCFKEAFSLIGEKDNLDNVIAVVVQPGVEFGEGSIHEYDRDAAKDLKNFIKGQTNLIFEGHSTDYQREEYLHQMAEDGIAILKVGPAVTFALREALVALENIEKIIIGDKEREKSSNFSYHLNKAMIENPIYWKHYYHGNENETRISRIFSLSDRCRYYLATKEVKEAMVRLVINLKTYEIPLNLISQYLPTQYMKIREDKLKISPEVLIKDKIRNIIDSYPQF